MWSLHVRFPSIQTPKNFIEDSRSIVSPFIFSSEAATEYYLFSMICGKKKTCFFLTFNNNLLALIQLLTFVSPLFIFSNKMLMSLCEKKRFLSPASMIGFSTFEAWCKSLTCNRNNKGPKMDLWGTPHVTVTALVELCSKEN